MTATEQLANAFMGSHPARAAMSLERMEMSSAAAVLGAVPPTVAARVFGEMTTDYAARCVSQVETSRAAAILSSTNEDNAAAIMRALDAERRDDLLARVRPATRESLTRLLAYPAGTAGAVMDASIFQLPEDVIVADARERLRGAAHDLLYYIYVVDRDRRLTGVLDIPELMLARARDPITVSMHRGVESISAWTPVALVREHPGWHSYHAMPVVDEHDRLLGAIRYQTVRRLEREAAGRTPNPTLLTAKALGDVLRLSATGMLAGVAAATSREPEPIDSPDDLDPQREEAR